MVNVYELETVYGIGHTELDFLDKEDIVKLNNILGSVNKADYLNSLDIGVFTVSKGEYNRNNGVHKFTVIRVVE